jgi:hypothetical protein
MGTTSPVLVWCVIEILAAIVHGLPTHPLDLTVLAALPLPAFNRLPAPAGLTEDRPDGVGAGVPPLRWTADGYATSPDGASVSHVYHGDGLGSSRALTDAAGVLTDTYTSDPNGGTAVGSHQGPSTQPFGYTGQL